MPGKGPVFRLFINEPWDELEEDIIASEAKANSIAAEICLLHCLAGFLE